MNKTDILNALDADIVERFRTAIALGKWPDGRKLTDKQRDTCMQAVMVWEHENLPMDERMGYIHKPKKEGGSHDGEGCDIEHDKHYPNIPHPKRDKLNQQEQDEERPIKFS